MVERILAATVITTLAILVIAGFGWIISFIFFDGGVKASDGSEVTDFMIFKLRLIIGTAFVGLFHGIGQIFNLFVFTFKNWGKQP